MKINLSQNLKKLRLEKGITQETLADFLGVTFQSVSRWERGESYPDITLLPLIAGYFGTTTDELLGVNKTANEEKIQKYLELYDTMKMVDMPLLFQKYKEAVKEFPNDYRIAVRYMELLQEEKLFNRSLHTDDYKDISSEITHIYESIQKYCTDDSIRIRSKKIMISHLMWKYDCICNEEGEYHFSDKPLNKAKAIVDTLPSISDSKELMAIRNKENYYDVQKTALEELMYHIHTELFGYCLDYPAEKRINQYEALQGLLELIYTDDDYSKNSFNRLYNFGHLGHLYHQAGNDEKAFEFLRKAAKYAVELDRNPEQLERIKRFYNCGPEHREMNACEFMKTVMTGHYPLSEEFKSSKEFKDVIASLN